MTFQLDENTCLRIIRLEEFRNEQPATIRTILNRLEKFEELAKELEKKDKRIQELTLQVQNHELALLDLRSLQHHQNACMNELKKQQPLINEQIFSQLKALQEDHQKARYLHETLHAFCSGLQGKIDMVKSDLVKSQAFHEPHVKFREEAKEKFKAIEKDLSEKQKSFDLAHEKIAHIKNITDLAKSESDAALNLLTQIKNQIPKDMNNMFFEFQNQLFGMREDFNRNWDKMSKPVDVEQLKKDMSLQFSQSFEQFALDVQNTALRASNNEAQLKQVEKKIENLQLLIKQLQLKG